VQYGHARCASILRKAGAPPGAAPDPGRLAQDAEWAVAKRLLDFGDALTRVIDGNEPHVLGHYLVDLCGDFSRWA
jgi:arginyl-tRNA synthetase